MEEIKAVVFDIDGTVTPHVSSWIAMTQDMGGSVEAHKALFKDFKEGAVSYEDSRAQLTKVWQETGNATRAKLQSIFENWPVFPEAQELISFLKSKEVQVAFITGSITIILHSGFAVSLHRFERYYLLGALVILLFWFMTSNAFVAFMLMQLLVTLGYVPVLQKMFVFKRNTESVPAWIFFFAAFLLGGYPAYLAWQQHGEILSLVYVARGAVYIGVTLIVGTYFTIREKLHLAPKQA